MLGSSTVHHDAAAAFVIDGEVVAAAQEERFNRLTHDASFLIYSIAHHLAHAQTRKVSAIRFACHARCREVGLPA